MNEGKKFIKSSAIYFVGNVLTKIISFFLLPLYTSKIATEDMGYFDVSVSYLGILVPVICMEIWSGILRYMFDYALKKDKYKPVTNGLLIFSVSVIVYTIIMIAVNMVFHINFIFLIYFYGLFTMLQSLYSFIARGLNYNTAFAFSGIIGSLVNSISNIIMILVLGMSLSSLYIAAILGFMVQVIILETKIKILSNLSFKLVDLCLMKNMFRFSIPLCFNSVCFWFLSSYNRVAITNILGLSANGVYSVSAKFAATLTLVTSCFSLAWQELVYSKGNEKDKSNLYSNATNLYIQFLMAVVLICMPLIQIVFPYFIDVQYAEAFSLIPMCLLATSASILSGFYGNIFGAEKKTGIILYSTIAAAIVNLGVLYGLINIFGIQAANISLLLGFIVNIFIRIFTLRKTAKIKINYKFLILSLLLFIIGFSIYLYTGTICNIVFLITMCIFFLYNFRKFIKSGLISLKKILKSRLKE